MYQLGCYVRVQLSDTETLHIAEVAQSESHVWGQIVTLTVTRTSTARSMLIGMPVIGATCAWCLSSAVIMTILFWLSLAPGRLSLAKLRK